MVVMIVLMMLMIVGMIVLMAGGVRAADWIERFGHVAHPGA